MGFLGGAPLSTPDSERANFTQRFQPSFGLAAESAYQSTRHLFGVKPLLDLGEVAQIRGYDGTKVGGGLKMIFDEVEESNPVSSLLSPEEANDKYGLGDKLKFTKPISEKEAAFKLGRAKDELKRDYVAQQNKGFLRNLGTFGVEFVGDLTDPIGLATLFIPITKFKHIAKATGKIGTGAAFGIGGAEALVGLTIPFTPGYFASKEFQYNFSPVDYGVSLAGGVVLGGALRKWLFGRDVKIKAGELLENITTAKNNLHTINEKHKKLNDEASELEQETLETSFKVYAELQTFFKNQQLSETLLKQIAEGKIDVEQFNRLRVLLDSLDEQNHRINDGAEYANSLFVAKKKIIDDSNLQLQENLTRLRALLESPDTHPDLKKPIELAIYETERTIALNNEKIKKFGQAAKRENVEEKSEGVDPDPQNNLSQEELDKIALERNKEVQELNADLEYVKEGGKVSPTNIIKHLKAIFGDKYKSWLDANKIRPKNIVNVLSEHMAKGHILTVKELAKLLKKDTISNDVIEKWLYGNIEDVKKPPNEKEGDPLNHVFDDDLDPNEGVQFNNEGQEIPSRKYTTTLDAEEAGTIVESEINSIIDDIEAGRSHISPDDPVYKGWKAAAELGRLNWDEVETLLSKYDVCNLENS